MAQFQSQQFSRDFPRDIVRRRPKTARHENRYPLVPNASASASAIAGPSGTVELAINPQPEREKSPGQ